MHGQRQKLQPAVIATTAKAAGAAADHTSCMLPVGQLKLPLLAEYEIRNPKATLHLFNLIWTPRKTVWKMRSTSVF